MGLLASFTRPSKAGPPSGPVSINYGHPMAQGLTGLWLFSDAMNHPPNNPGGPYNAVSETPAANTGGAGDMPYSWTQNAFGPAVLQANSNFALTGTSAFQSNHMVPTDRVTILLVMRLPSGSSTSAFGIGLFGADCCRAHCPFVDNIIYWDFGGASGVNRLATAALTWNPDQIYMVGLVAGSRGSAIYRNGAQVASQTTAITRTGGGSFDLRITGDPVEFNFFAILNAEWLPTQMLEWMADPYAMVSPASGLSRFFLLPFVAPVDEFTIVDSTVSPQTAVARDILQNWQISEQLNERGTMRFGVKSMDASYRPLLREQIDFHWAGQHFFAGHIHHTDEGGLGGYGVVPIVTQCGATDFNALPDRRQVAITLTAGTLKSMLEAIDDYLTIYGVTLDPAQVNGPTIAEDLVFTLGPLTAILNKLSVVTGYAWNISYDKVLSMFAPGTEAAPFDLVDGDTRVIGDVRVSPTTVNYGNHITVKYTEPAFSAYVYFVMDAIPVDGETFKVGGTVFTFKNTPVDPNDVQIQGNVPDTLDEMVAAIDPLDEVLCGIQAADAIRVTAAEAGAAGNSIQVETNCVDSHWGVEGVPIASHLYNGADAALTGTVIAQDIPAQDGGANLYELVFEEPTAESEATAQALADGYLVRSLVQPREIRYRTRLHGLHPGQQQRIQVTGRNIGAGSPPGSPCLITAVDISPEGSALYNYDVTAVEGLIIVPSYQDAWRTLAGRVA